MFEYGHWVSEVERPESSKAFVYIIKLDIDGVEKLYIGYKTIRGNRWMGYKTSSKVVKPLWENVVEAKIVEWFDNETDAEDREIEMLKAVNAAKNELYLNQHNGCPSTAGTTLSDSHKNAIGKASRFYCDQNREKVVVLLNYYRPLSIIATKNSEKIKNHNHSEKNKSHLRIQSSSQKRLDAIRTSEKSRRQRIEVQKTMVEKNKRKCTDGIIIFESVKEAAKHYQVQHSTISYRLRKGLYGWKYI